MNATKAISLLALVLTSAAPAQQPADPREADHDALRALGVRYEQAINEGNLKPLADSVLPEASAVFVTGKEVQGLDAMQKYYDEVKAQLGAGSSLRVKMQPERSELHGDTALAHGRSDETATLGNGTVVSYQTLWTAVLVKRDGQWKAARLHVSMDPIDNPIVAMKTKWRERLFAGGGLLIGVLAAMALAFWRGRRAKA